LTIGKRRGRIFAARDSETRLFDFARAVEERRGGFKPPPL
jgi:hypothetical protein